MVKLEELRKDMGVMLKTGGREIGAWTRKPPRKHNMAIHAHRTRQEEGRTLAFITKISSFLNTFPCHI
jgi:hypothetical protein